MNNLPLIVITGPTAVGKTKLAVSVANEVGGEIINADSRQVYKGMDIGTGKDLKEYDLDGKSIPYHLIDICDAGYKYNIKEYQHDFKAVYKDLKSRQKPAVLCGGSGLYIESALQGNPYAFIPLDHALRDELKDESKSILIGRISKDIKKKLNITNLTTPKRLIRAVEISNFCLNHPIDELEDQTMPSIIFVIALERELILDKIYSRLQSRLENGLIGEIKGLLASDISPEQLLYYGLEYRWVTMYLLREMTYDQMVDRLNISIRQFAKRQMTWFRRMERNGYEINWLDGKLDIPTLKEKVISKL